MQNSSQQKTFPPELKSLWNEANIVIGHLTETLNDRIFDLFGSNILIVSDVNTHDALGKHCSSFSHLTFPAPPKADIATVKLIRETSQNVDALVAIGSGTLNDLCKYASFCDNKPYAVVATAPSMNGYVSANASILKDNYKHTLSAHPPKAVWCDIPTLQSAPIRLHHAGIGDTLCRSTVQADWLLSHLVTGTDYRPHYFDWLAPYESQLFSLLAESKPDISSEVFSTNLITALLISGLAMRDYGSSAPASQGEHMLAHTMEMLHPDLPHHFHGEEIAVTSLALSQWQQSILSKKTPPTISYRDDATIQSRLPLHMHEQALNEYHAKLATARTLEGYNDEISSRWPELRETILPVTVPHEQLTACLSQAGAPTTAEQLGWETEKFQQALRIARFTRQRFTFLDLC